MLFCRGASVGSLLSAATGEVSGRWRHYGSAPPQRKGEAHLLPPLTPYHPAE